MTLHQCDNCGRVMAPKNENYNHVSLTIGSVMHDGIQKETLKTKDLCDKCLQYILEAWDQINEPDGSQHI